MIADTPADRSAGPLVLVADDDPAIRSLVEALLHDEGFRCLTAEDGERLVALLGDVRPDAVVLDIRMPRLDGFGVIARIRADPALNSIPVVAVSAEASAEPVLAAGCRAFLPKPFDLDELVSVVWSAIAGSAPVRG